MRTWKKTVSVALTLMLLVLSGCGKNGSTQKGRDSVKDVIDAADIVTSEKTSATEEKDQYTEEDLKVQEAFEEFMTEAFCEEMESDYLTMHFTLEDPSKYNLTVPEATWGEYSIDQISDYSEIEELKAEVLSYEYDSLTKQQQYLRDSVVSYIDFQLGFEGLEYFDNPFGSLNGDPFNLPTNLTEFRIANEDDALAYIDLLIDTKNYMDYLCQFADYKVEHGVFLADFAIDNTLAQLDKFMENPEENPVILVYNEKVDALSVSAEEKETLKADAKKAFDEYFMPGYQQLYDKMVSLKGTGTNEGGLCNYEKGKDYYVALVKKQTSSDYTPEELADILDDYMNSKMMTLYTLIMKDESYMDAYMSMDTYYEESDPVAALKSLEDFAREEFPEIPETEFKISPLDACLEDDSMLAYYMPHPYDNINQNVIRTNNSLLGDDLESLYSTLSHEGFPGHLYHFVYEGSRDLNPMAYLMSDFLGCVEGWARFIEEKAVAYHLQNDDLAQIVAIDTDLGYGIQGRIDIGVNYEGWMVEDVEDYLNDFGFDSSYAQELFDVVVEEPGLYLPYAVSPILLKNLEEKAEKKLGSDFDQKEFYEALLYPGFTTYENMEKSVMEYIDKKNVR